MTDESKSESLLLKWGTLKGWDIESEKALSLMRQYVNLGMAMGGLQQRDTAEQKAILCSLIDIIDGPIQNDWTGLEMTKAEAKQYVIEYN